MRDEASGKKMERERDETVIWGCVLGRLVM